MNFTRPAIFLRFLFATLSILEWSELNSCAICSVLYFQHINKNNLNCIRLQTNPCSIPWVSPFKLMHFWSSLFLCSLCLRQLYTGMEVCVAEPNWKLMSNKNLLCIFEVRNRVKYLKIKTAMRRGDGSCCSCSVPEVSVQHSSVPFSISMSMWPCRRAGNHWACATPSPKCGEVYFSISMFSLFLPCTSRKTITPNLFWITAQTHPDITCHLGNSRWYIRNQQQPARAEGPHACVFCLLFVSKCDLQNKNTQILSKHFLAKICFGLKH